MEIRYFRINNKIRQKILENITTFLKKDKKILLAFAYGSFIAGAPFRDIDIAVWLEDSSDFFYYTIYKSVELEEKIGFPVDLHVLNTAPLTFRYHVIVEGKLLFTRDPKLLYRLVESTLKEYWDFKLLLSYSI